MLRQEDAQRFVISLIDESLPSKLLNKFSLVVQTADFAGGIDNSGKVMTVLQPLWSILPSPEARTAKFGDKNSRSF